MKLKLDNRLAQLPNEISIDRFESHAHMSAELKTHNRHDSSKEVN